ncbi:DUF1566 domain-containing protein [Candidatus Desantisbacteria bacterium]|nr:DUF1566 domain-containing protein [Candidatus Desantisbacteria bacterium]
MRRLLFGMIGAALLFGTPTLSFAEPGTSGVTAGTNIVSGGDAGTAGITDTAGDVVATFKVGDSGTKNVTCVVATVTVGQIYGGKWGTLPEDKSELPAKTVDYEYQIINLGNATDVFTISWDFSELPTGWTAQPYKNGVATNTITIAEDAMATFTMRIGISGTANDNEKGVITVTASTSHIDGAAYIVGAWQYGGDDSLTDSATTTCSSAIIALTKTYQVQTPAGYTGTNANVPGSLITYCIEYRNTGSADASNVSVTDMIPGHTTYVTGSIRTGAVGDTYAAAVGETDAIDGDNAQFSASIVQFNLATVAAAASGRLYYQVRIDGEGSSTTGASTFTTTFTIGQSYGGGKIFYIDGTGQHGLIAAESDQSAGLQWYNGSNITTGAAGTAVGAGQANTTAIVTAQGAGSYAAKLCDDLVLNGYSDWFLPSKDELGLLWQQRSVVGGFVSNFYWSSTEGDSDVAWGQWYSVYNDQYTNGKGHTFYVRAMRAF